MPDRNLQFKPHKLGFTLIELLVVVAIIVVLLAILLPSLGRARAVAKDTACASNVRQITMGLFAYATSFDNFLPAAQEVPVGTAPTWHLRIWDFMMNRPYNIADTVTPFNYLTKTVFECPQAALISKMGYGGYVTNDHRCNGYALNVSTPGILPNGTIVTANTMPNVDTDETLRSEEYKRLNLVRNPSQTMMLTDAQGFYVEYYDRGASLNQMDVLGGNQYAGRMLDAVGRHGIDQDAWNMSFFDGSARLLHFNEVPGAPANRYSSAGRYNPDQLLNATDVSADTKIFWTGMTP